jgi:hypothetical protein
MTMPPSALKDILEDCGTAGKIWARLKEARCLSWRARIGRAKVEALIGETLNRPVDPGTLGPSPLDRVLLVLSDRGFLNRRGKYMFKDTGGCEGLA